MKHFAAERWVDFVRGLVAEPEHGSMVAHLSAGCQKCQRMAGVMASLVGTAAAASRYEPPREVAGRVTTLYAPPSQPKHATRSVPMQLVYDSFRQPLPAGVRGGDRPSQALYQTANHSLDLCMNRERLKGQYGAARMVLVGQITDRKAPGRRLSEMPVMLISGRRVAAHGVSNEWGEFHFEYDPKKRLRLQVPLEGGKRIEIPLHRWGGPPAEPSGRGRA